MYTYIYIYIYVNFWIVLGLNRSKHIHLLQVGRMPLTMDSLSEYQSIPSDFSLVFIPFRSLEWRIWKAAWPEMQSNTWFLDVLILLKFFQLTKKLHHCIWNDSLLSSNISFFMKYKLKNVWDPLKTDDRIRGENVR